MLKVLIAEDDDIMAGMLENILVRNGYVVCGTARTVDGAVALCERHKPDLAVLDVRLADGGYGTEIVARLNGESRPGILYATSNTEHITLAGASGDACLSKPFCTTDIVWALEIVQQLVTTGTAESPFPMGFHVLQGASRTATTPAPAGSKSGDAFKQLRERQATLARFWNFALFVGGMDDVLTEAAHICAKGLNVPFSSVWRYRPAQSNLIMTAGAGWPETVIGRVIAEADASSPPGQAFTTEDPVISVDLSKDMRFALPPFYNQQGIISSLDVIIKADGKPYGVLAIASPVQHNFDQDDINFLTAVASVLAAAVKKFKLRWPPIGPF